MDESSPEFQLGDGVHITGGRLDGTRGRIYYMDDERIRILPVGASDRLIEIPLIDGDLDPSLGITSFYQTSKRAEPAFVSQIDAHVGQAAETFGINGEPGIFYVINEVNEREDTIILVDETGAEKRIEFDFKGIPLEEGFAVLRPRQLPGVEPDEEIIDVNDDLFENIDVEEPVGLVERPVTQRVYPDIVQRNDMFQDLLQMISVSSQKDAKKQKELRRQVEQLLLIRNEVVKYTLTGEPIGKLLTSYQTIAELIEKTDIPLARPVLEAKRTVYLDYTNDENPIELPGVDIDVQYHRKIVDESNDYLSTQLGGTTSQIVTPDALPQWYVGWETFFKRYMRTWISDGSPGDAITFTADKEFLRAPVPDGDSSVDGLIKIPINSPGTVDSVGKVPFSLLKGIGPRAVNRRVESGDEGIFINQLVFPLNTARDLGTIRTGMLAKDISLSYSTSRTMGTILKDLGGVVEEPTGEQIICIGENGNTSGNIPLEVWLKIQPIIIEGLGDALVELKNLGITQFELSIDQQAVLVEKMNQYRALIKNFITSEREHSTKALGELRLENLPFLQGESLEEFLITLESEPLIQKRMDEIRARTPAYKENDIALVAGVCVEMADLFLSVLAGQPAPLARERNRLVREQFLEALRRALLKAEKRATAGEIPQPIQCPHTDSLNEIRKVKNDDDRMQLLARLLARFRGPVKDNWIVCSASAQGHPHNLLCYHEFLQLQEYLHPREKDALHKELLLKFSGGSFQGKYMCKNCGQAISEIEFDQSMEFDDNGRPMASSAVLIDTATENQVDMMLGEPTEEYKDTFNETQATIYKATRQLFDRLGIYAQNDTFKNIIERVESDIQKQPSREEYTKMIKKKEGKPLDYDILINRLLVSAIGAHSLIEIQAHVPDFIIRYKIPGCTAGFTGFPIGKEDDKTGINYISCAIASIRSAEAPWSLSGFLTIAADKKRQEVVAGGVQKMVDDSMKTAVVQQLLSVKRAYYEKIYGKVMTSDSIPEYIPDGFLPVPYFIKAEDATKAIVVPDAASKEELVRAWIQSGHMLARQNGTYVAGSPFSETSCCYTQINTPRAFWGSKESAMPKLPEKSSPRGKASSFVTLPFKPRRAARLLADPPEELFYRVFLRVCYDGPRKGLPHEPGYTNMCPHCGFTFPENPYTVSAGPPLTKDGFKEWQTEMEGMITNGKSALESQKVIVDKGSFEDVLDAAHRRFHVFVPEAEKPTTGTALLGQLAKLEPEPFEGCRKLLNSVITRVSSMAANAGEMEVAETYGPLSDHLIQTLGDIEVRIGKNDTLLDLLKQSPTQIVESVRTYFLVPFQRLILQFRPRSLKVMSSYGLPKETREDVDDALQAHLGYLEAIQKNVKGYAEIKLKQAQEQLSVLLNMIQKHIRSTLIPGGETATGYIIASLVVGVLGEFINPNVIPDGVSGTGGAIDTTSRAPIQILEVCLSRLKLEGLKFTEDEIRDLIARRTAAENDLFTTRQNKMTQEEKKSDLMMKRLGLGAWSVGGTKAVYTLNAEQYGREKDQRMEMGLGNLAVDPVAAAEAYELVYGGGGEGAEGGYDVDQMAADDY
jgi:hypothetical protein